MRRGTYAFMMAVNRNITRTLLGMKISKRIVNGGCLNMDCGINPKADMHGTIAKRTPNTNKIQCTIELFMKKQATLPIK